MVKHHTLHFSPWVALGLPSNHIPTVPQTKAAFNRAILHCHADRRDGVNIPNHRWPTIDHLIASRDYFVDLENGGVLSTLYPPNKFSEFPTTFHPEHDLGQAGVYTEARQPGFFTCTECYMVMKTASKHEHLTSHQLSACQFCDDVIPVNELLEHHQEQHGIHLLSTENLATYIRDRHTCPYCGDCFIGLQEHVNSEHGCDCRRPDEAWEEHIDTQHTCCQTYHRDLAKHLQESHYCECRGFQNYNDFAAHVRRDHICPYCGIYDADLAGHVSLNHYCRHCNEPQSDLPEHIKATHKCIYCFDLFPLLSGHIQTTHECHQCGEIHRDLDDHIASTHRCGKCTTNHTNIQSHLRKHCDKCDFVAEDPAASLLKHIFEIHHLAVCADCNLATPLGQIFWEHVNTSHEWVGCPLCEVLLDKTHVDHHLAHLHEWVRCEACPDTASLDAKDHFATSHAMLDCEYCRQTHSRRAMMKHLLTHHNGKQCPYCDEVKQEIPLRSHIQQAHQPRKCLHCDGEFPARELLAHSQTAHFAKLCPYCHYYGSESDIEQHTSQYHISCEDCTGRFSIVHIRNHRREVHSWEDCPDCVAQCPPAQLAEHRKDHGLLQCPFSDCSEPLTMNTLAAHIYRKHSKASCPFCDECKENLEAHISRHVSEYEQDASCPDCGEESERVPFFAHVLSHRIRPSHGSAEKARSACTGSKDSSQE
ncbi:hypothetical protein GGR57DRAFT_476898 [Xylariaceae sp. FL1272]|nr:hypothetical protein GGR57DRAFT_476898 [Xylariaceae sp. FL1272]